MLLITSKSYALFDIIHSTHHYLSKTALMDLFIDISWLLPQTNFTPTLNNIKHTFLLLRYFIWRLRSVKQIFIFISQWIKKMIFFFDDRKRFDTPIWITEIHNCIPFPYYILDYPNYSSLLINSSSKSCSNNMFNAWHNSLAFKSLRYSFRIFLEFISDMMCTKKKII